MAGRGRFGKYGELKRKDKMRLVRLIKARKTKPSGSIPIEKSRRLRKPPN